MQEGDQLAGRAVKWLLVDEAHTGAGGLLELTGDIVGSEGEVVDAFAPVRQEFCDRALGGRRLQ